MFEAFVGAMFLDFNETNCINRGMKIRTIEIKPAREPVRITPIRLVINKHPIKAVS